MTCNLDKYPSFFRLQLKDPQNAASKFELIDKLDANFAQATTFSFHCTISKRLLRSAIFHNEIFMPLWSIWKLRRKCPIQPTILRAFLVAKD
jgi:hypothetical protein